MLLLKAKIIILNCDVYNICRYKIYKMDSTKNGEVREL